ncbi:hypothetical protein HID58_002075 [Brassica napus]|uniref:Uncharacterized protein n=2 Tax=Brassica TaxID=3705 RepID=A0ABQ8ELR1_BRANA|nr:hypothetical protein HID58_002075 [Brassica napus]
MGSRESSTMCSSQVIRNSSIYVFACVLIAALGYIQFGFTCDYSSPTKAAITKDLSLTVFRTKGHPFPEHIRWSHISNDTIKIDMEENKIVEFIKFAVGNVVMVAGGTNRGRGVKLTIIEEATKRLAGQHAA